MIDKTPKSIKSKKIKYSKINFWSCTVAIIMAVALLILNILNSLKKIEIYICIYWVIAFGIIGLIAIIPMSVSWLMLRKLNKQPPENEEEKSVKLTESEVKWNKLWELYGNGKWDNPIFYLCDYESGINGEGHFGFFFNTGNSQENGLQTYCVELRKVFPNDLYDNFNKAYQCWLQGDDEQSEKACNVADEFFYQNENKIIEILQRYANTLEI